MSLEILCPKCGKPSSTCTCNTLADPICQICGERHPVNIRCRIISKLCTRCGGINTANHICVPKHLQCATCGKPTVAIESCSGIHIVRGCPICGSVPRIVFCRKCGEAYRQCKCPSKHMCRIIPQINCPLCGGAHSIKDCPLLQLQRVVPEKELGKYFDDGWVFKVQLQSGDVIVEKDVDVEEITAKVMEQAAKQIADEIAQVDIEKITDKVMEQAAKQIGEAVAKEKQRLLKE